MSILCILQVAQPVIACYAMDKLSVCCPLLGPDPLQGKCDRALPSEHLVYRRHFGSVIIPCILESIFSHTNAGGPGDDLLTGAEHNSSAIAIAAYVSMHCCEMTAMTTNRQAYICSVAEPQPLSKSWYASLPTCTPLSSPPPL